MITPLPEARPLALTTIGARCARSHARIVVGAREHAIGGGRNAVALQEFLGEGLRAFEPRRQPAADRSSAARRR